MRDPRAPKLESGYPGRTMNGPVSAAARALCVLHTQAAASATCPRCGGFRCDACLLGRSVCRDCAAQLVSASPIAQRARWARFTLWATVAAKGVLLLLLLATAVFPSSLVVRANGYFSLPDGVIGIATIVTFLMWNHALATLVTGFGLDGDSPVLAVVWWFVPFANLVKPYLNLRESLVQLRSEVAVDEARLGWWWGLWLGGNLVGFTYRSNGQVVQSVVRTAISLIMTGVAAYLAVRMIGVMQRALRAYATPELPVFDGPVAERPAFAANA